MTGSRPAASSRTSPPARQSRRRQRCGMVGWHIRIGKVIQVLQPRPQLMQAVIGCSGGRYQALGETERDGAGRCPRDLQYFWRFRPGVVTGVKVQASRHAQPRPDAISRYRMLPSAPIVRSPKSPYTARTRDRRPLAQDRLAVTAGNGCHRQSPKRSCPPPSRFAPLTLSSITRRGAGSTCILSAA